MAGSLRDVVDFLFRFNDQTEPTWEPTIAWGGYVRNDPTRLRLVMDAQNLAIGYPYPDTWFTQPQGGAQYIDESVDITQVPEPTTAALLGLGLAALAVRRRS